MSDLINYTAYPADFMRSIAPLRENVTSRGDFLAQERRGIFNDMRALERRLSEIEKDLGRFERRINRSS